MYKFFNKYGSVLGFGLGALVVGVFLIQVFGGLEDFNLLSKEDKGGTTIFNFGLKGTIFLIGLAAFLWIVVFGIINATKDFRDKRKFLIGALILALIFLVFYLMAKTDASPAYQAILGKYNVGETANKLISAGLNTTVVLLIGAAATFIFSEIRNVIK